MTRRARVTAALCFGGREAAGSWCTVSDWMLMASPILQASNGPRCHHHSAVKTKCWRLPVQAGEPEDSAFLL